MLDKKLVSQIKENITNKYSLSDEDIDMTFDLALGDYLRLKYPSDNNRPTLEQCNIDFATSQWILSRMIDIIDRAGYTNVESYRENGISIEYGSSQIDPVLVGQIMPRAGVPR